mmetsp:Transcript_48752/g.112803  ORF Transcript_48752/g.112803 Transcript_48752/m.112803 type:complete len:171 (-) Transcript_48752:225-737(-)|eukprot:CAMPEP_0119393038 /NCGR_PEP_ID=MMETSP1334-20130426/123798_1 /TAXON_ID=127549 /ORGANISM="Calcidiscus leptoporus, Strain RCC1130" /LENGTH=170 /DNA_ID=CAMNT_0007416013 /DNA_START=8 /DNA_END=520 /DNA_ORIENTATION=+
MSSAGGPRAKGTDGTDFQYRQRVDNHYKLMADARKSLRTAYRAQFATSLGLAVRAAFVLVSNDSPTLCTACGMLALGMLVAARLGFVAGKSQQPVGHAASYKRACILLALFLLALAIGAGATHNDRPAALALLLYLEACVLFGLASVAVGTRGARRLCDAFELQAKKRGK